MDLDMWLTALAQSSLLLAVAWVMSAAVFGAAVASYGRIPLWIGIVGAVAVPVLGLIVLLIVAIVRSASQRTLRRGATAAGVPAPGTSPSNQGSVVATSPFARPTPVDARSGTEAGVAAPLRPPARAPFGRLRTRSGLAGTAALVLLALAATSTLFIRWFRFDSQILPALSVWAWGTGIDVLVLASVAVLMCAVLLSALRPSRWAAVLAAGVGACWASAAGLAIIVAAPVTTVLTAIGAQSYSMGDALESLGMDTSAATIPLPDGIDLSVIGITGTQLDLASIDLAAPIPTATLELGGSFFVALVVGVLALTWSVTEIFLAHRASVRRRE